MNNHVLIQCRGTIKHLLADVTDVAFSQLLFLVNFAMADNITLVTNQSSTRRLFLHAYEWHFLCLGGKLRYLKRSRHGLFLIKKCRRCTIAIFSLTRK